MKIEMDALRLENKSLKKNLDTVTSESNMQKRDLKQLRQHIEIQKLKDR